MVSSVQYSVYYVSVSYGFLVEGTVGVGVSGLGVVGLSNEPGLGWAPGFLSSCSRALFAGSNPGTITRARSNSCRASFSRPPAMKIFPISVW